MTELKPCPFCGGAAVYQDEQDWHWVQCSQCGSRSGFSSSKRPAIAAWNRRTLLTVTREELVEMIRDHIRVDATGLAPMVVSAFVIGQEGAAAAILAFLRRKEVIA